MREQLEARLLDLRGEFATGQAAMAEIGRKQEELRAMLLRIGGAIQVLEELLGQTAAHTQPQDQP
ncbi:hypothetical protein [Roseateles sp. BYS96W]|uniref:hypothetical protein n=1 Tax=Pelomonas nitida TaxID=3299027 RepID=UPI003749EC79